MRTVQHFKERVLLFCAAAAVLLLAGCAGRTIQYPAFPDQTKRIEDPSKARVYLIRPPGGGGTLLLYGAGFAAVGPRVDPRPWAPPELGYPAPAPQVFGFYPQNPAPDTPWRTIGELASGSYMCWEQPPEVLTLPRNPLNLLAGNVYYLRVTTPGAWVPRLQVDLISEEEGQALLKKCKPPAGY